ncbi:peptidylprolyl isomerase [Candidatus Woesearchaeota archaeon]|nr:peptidylprolyl isomerase [Candidatus Woesearchaeota archaeon]
MFKKGDFIQVDFIGKTKDDNKVFDLTREEDAKKHNLHNPKTKYKPLIVCIGERNLLKGLDDFLIEKTPGKYTIDLKSEEAFGTKNPQLIKMVPLNLFQKQNIKPFPGLRINMDNIIGTVRTVSGGRVVMDFNHPLAGREVIYEIDVKGPITDTTEKIKGFLEVTLGVSDFELKDNNLTINAQLPEAYQKPISDTLKRLIPEVKEIHFKTSNPS